MRKKAGLDKADWQMIGHALGSWQQDCEGDDFWGDWKQAKRISDLASRISHQLEGGSLPRPGSAIPEPGEDAHIWTDKEGFVVE